jgi:hypothetical protein
LKKIKIEIKNKINLEGKKWNRKAEKEMKGRENKNEIKVIIRNT